MGGSRIFDWGGPRIEEARGAGQNVAIFALRSWPIGGGHGPVAPPLEPPMEPTQQFPQTSPRVQSVQQPQSVPFQTQQFQSPQLTLPQNSLNLLNANNFQAFDAQFGGSVPTNPGASQLSSSIFTQPGTSLLQGRDVLVSPQNNFQITPIQSGQVFQSASSPSSSNVPQLASQSIPSASFSGHPANGINLQTGAFNLRTG